MGQYVLGVDGGTTKTHYALFDIEGNRIDLLQSGPTNHERLAGSFEELRDVLKSSITEILSRNKIEIDHIKGSVFGLSGVDTKSQHKKISEILDGIGLKNFILCNDAYLGIKAGCKDGMGICVVNGTGWTICGIDHKGKMLQLCGQGELTGEFGGGGYLGAQAVQEVYRYLFRCGKETRLKNLLFEKLEVNSKYDFIDTLCNKIDSKEIRLSDLSQVIFTAANQGDDVALEILQNMGRETAASVNGMIRELEFSMERPLEIILTGSIHLKGENATAIQRLKVDIIAQNPGRDIRFVLLDKPPVSGAVVWALHEVRQDNVLYEKVVSQMSFCF